MTRTSSILRAAAVIGGVLVLLNIAFFVLSGLYFDDHTMFVGGAEVPAYTPELAMSVRLAFALFSCVVSVAALAAVAEPRWVGHGIAAAMGLGSFVAGCVAAARGMPGALIGAELVLGAVMPFLAVRSLSGARPAWAFLIAICAVYAVVLLFGAPTVRKVLHLGLWTTLILPGLNVVAASALVSIRARYR